MREYKIEMLKNGKWKPASLPFNGIVPVTFERRKAVEMVHLLKKEWKKAFDNGDLLYKEYMPVKYRMFSREVSDWVEERICKGA